MADGSDDGGGYEPCRPTAFHLALDLTGARAAGDRYTGTATVSFFAECPTAALPLHCHPDVAIDSLRVTQGKKVAKIAAVTRPTADAMAIALAEPLAVGQWDVVAAFNARVRDDSVGIYAAAAGPGGAFALATHFEVTEARKAFPCVDDSACRVPTTVSLAVPRQARVIANACEKERRERGAADALVTFEATAPLPTYVLGFVVTTLPFVGDVRGTVPRSADDDGDEIELSIHRFNEKFDSKKVLQYLTRSVVELTAFFGVPLPHRRIAVVALPKMAISGMENDGVIFLQAALGVPAGQGAAGAAAADDVLAQFVAHEVAHHWVGNMVGLGFGVKEGVCLVLERHFGDVLRGRAPRKVQPAPPAAAAGAAEQGKKARKGAALHQADEGKELTGLTYQRSELAMLDVVAALGWERFRGALRRICAERAGELVTDAEFEAYLAEA
jgi:aminopeptidase N